jgi:predicted enzyme related to lactoylglutathione lyase
MSALVLALLSSAEAQLLPPGEVGITMRHVHLNVCDLEANVCDLEAHKKFWVDQFGAIALQRDRVAGVKLPGMLILFRRQAAPKGRVLDHLGFEVKNLEAFCRKLESAGVKLYIPYKKLRDLGIAFASLADSLGVYIELHEGLDKY